AALAGAVRSAPRTPGHRRPVLVRSDPSSLARPVLVVRGVYIVTQPGRSWTMMTLENKVAVIYGARGAIGGAVARAMAREGARVYGTSHEEVDALDEAAIDRH